jgi:hypothetical protein
VMAAGVECSYFFIETGFWVLLVVGEVQGRQAGSLKSIQPKKLTYIGIRIEIWPKKYLNPNYLFLQTFTARPSSLKTCQ